MNKKLRRKLKVIFTNNLFIFFPQFKETPQRIIRQDDRNSEEYPPGSTLYVWTYAEDLYFYIMLYIPSTKPELCFTIEGAFTKHKRFPIFSELMFPYGVPRSGILPTYPQNGDMRFRIGALLKNSGDLWWRVIPKTPLEEIINSTPNLIMDDTLLSSQGQTEDVLFREIESLVKNALEKIRFYLIPYYYTIIEKYKKTPNFWDSFLNR